MADLRNCEQCGTAFTPRREHGRFCSARCRVAWNRREDTAPPTDASALLWSITAMSDTTDKLPRIRGLDRPRAFAVIGEAVWWVTIVDSTLVRYHPEAYDGALGARPPAERKLIEDTLAGLRFVRNRMGADVDHVDFIHLEPTGSVGEHRVADWRWNPMPELTFDWLTPRGQEWEMARYEAYQGQLAGHRVGETFRRAAMFLQVAAADATSDRPAGPYGRERADSGASAQPDSPATMGWS
jgi:hypothetical protein